MNIHSVNSQVQQQITAKGSEENTSAKVETSMNSVSNTASTEKLNKSEESVRRMVRDQYTPSSKTPQGSCGLYRPVMDEAGKIKIQFDKPVTETKNETTSQSVRTAESGTDNQTMGSQEKNVSNVRQAQGEPEGELTKTKDDTKPSKSAAQPASNGKQKIQDLKKKKNQLKQKIQSTSDEGKVSELKKKLAQVERELKTAKQ